MEARSLVIEEKCKDPVFRVAGPSDFSMRDDGAVDPQIVLKDPNLSLYCLDFENQQALFVQTSSECDLASAPFVYAAQYEAAQRLVQIPFDALHRLAAEAAIDPASVTLIYSVGRCGSTLVSSAFRQVEGVQSLSEPDVFTQMLAYWRPDNLEGEEKAALVKSCAQLVCAPGKARGATAWALKFRSMVTHMGPLFYSALPEATVVFLYRSVEPWMRSMLRMRGSDPRESIPRDRVRAMFGPTDPRLEGREVVSLLEMHAWWWLSIMEASLRMQRLGIPMFIARYEELNSAPHEMLTQMFAHCGLAGRAVHDLDAVLARDSQEGTMLSRESLGEKPARLTPDDIEELRRIICEGLQELTADQILPGTYLPESKKVGC